MGPMSKYLKSISTFQENALVDLGAAKGDDSLPPHFRNGFARAAMIRDRFLISPGRLPQVDTERFGHLEMKPLPSCDH